MEDPQNDDSAAGRPPDAREAKMEARVEARARRKLRDEQITETYGYRILTALAVLLLATGTIAYHFLEDWSWVDSLYFSSVAVSTVGFGDLVPSTDISKLFTIVYVFSGIAIITSFLNTRLKRHASTIADRVRSRMPQGRDDDDPGSTP